MKAWVIVVTLLLTMTLGCAAKKPKLEMVVPRECMGRAEFASGRCVAISETLVKCTDITLVMPIYCTQVKK